MKQENTECGARPYVAVTTRCKGYVTGTRIYANDPEDAIRTILSMRKVRDGKLPVRLVRIYDGHFDPKIAAQMVPVLEREFRV